MSTIPYWLQRQRKPDLQDLAAHVGLNGYDKLLKPDLEIILNDHLRAHQSQFQSDAKLSGYYKILRRDSPVKRESGGVSVVEEKKPKSRRQTLKAREELEGQGSDTEPSNALTPAAPGPRTPPPSSTLSLPLPSASPSLLADRIEYQTSTLTTTLSNAFTTSRVPATATWLRSTLSSTPAIQLFILSIELAGLLSVIMPMKYAGYLPPMPALGLEEGVRVKLPDMFALLTWAFWGPMGVWLGTSVLIPEIGGWMINLRRAGGGGQVAGNDGSVGNGRVKEVMDSSTENDFPSGSDPVTWGVVKGLCAWILFTRTPSAFRGESFGTVEAAVPGGAVGMMVGAGVCVLGGVYEAVLRR